jgi:hypothetical protein
MHRKNIKKISIVAIAIFLVLSLVSCIGWEIVTTATDMAKIFEQKNVGLFMQNISYYYSDTNGNTFSTMGSVAEELISQVEEIEDLADSMFEDVVVDVSINNLILAESYADGEMKIDISIKYFNYIPSFWPADTYPKTIIFNVDFQKNGSEWEIISMEEIF